MRQTVINYSHSRHVTTAKSKNVEQGKCSLLASRPTMLPVRVITNATSSKCSLDQLGNQSATLIHHYLMK